MAWFSDGKFDSRKLNNRPQVRCLDSRKLNNRLATVLQIRPLEVLFSIFETFLFSKLPNLPVFRRLIQPNTNNRSTLTTLILPPTLCVWPGSSTGNVSVLRARGSEIEPRRIHFFLFSFFFFLFSYSSSSWFKPSDLYFSSKGSFPPKTSPNTNIQDGGRD